MASALTLTAIATRDGKLRTLPLIGTDEVRSQIETIFDAINLPVAERNDIFDNEGGFEIDRALITDVDLTIKEFINGHDVGEAMWEQFDEAVRTIEQLDETFDNVRIVAEVA